MGPAASQTGSLRLGSSGEGFCKLILLNSRNALAEGGCLGAPRCEIWRRPRLSRGPNVTGRPTELTDGSETGGSRSGRMSGGPTPKRRWSSLLCPTLPLVGPIKDQSRFWAPSGPRNPCSRVVGAPLALGPFVDNASRSGILCPSWMSRIIGWGGLVSRTQHRSNSARHCLPDRGSYPLPSRCPAPERDPSPPWSAGLESRPVLLCSSRANRSTPSRSRSVRSSR